MSKNREDVLIHTFSSDFVQDLEDVMLLARRYTHRLGSVSSGAEFVDICKTEARITALLTMLRAE